MQSAAAPKPKRAPPSPPMPHPSPDHPGPMPMTAAELEAAIAALPGKRDALREAFDRLAACSPSPLPFAWEDLDAHITSLQSSIALRFRQFRLLEAAGAAPAAASPGGTRGGGKGENQEEEVDEVVEVEEEEEVVEVKVEEEDVVEVAEEEEEVVVEVAEEVVEVAEEVAKLEKKADEDEEMQEADCNKIDNDGKDSKEARAEVLVEEEVEEATNVMIGNEIKVEKEARKEEHANKVNEQDADKEMQVVDEEELNTKNVFKSPQEREGEKDHDTNMNATAAKMASSVQHKDEAYSKKQEQEVEQEELNTKDAFKAVQEDDMDEMAMEVEEVEKKADDNEEMQETGCAKIGNDGKEAREEVVGEGEVEEPASIIICNEIKDEEAREEEKACKVNEQDADKEMQVVDGEELNTKNVFKDSREKEGEKDQDTNMNETAAKQSSSVQHKDEACGKKQEQVAQEQDVHERVEGAKNAMGEELVVANEVSSDQGTRASPGRSNDRTAACRNMDAQRLIQLICTSSNTEFISEFNAVVRGAPDVAALALHVVQLFLHNKFFFKTNKAWANCVGLVQRVPVVVTKPSANTVEQAKQMAKDWKEMIDNQGSCKILGSGSLASWGLLCFIISYNIVTEFNTKEIFHLFGNISFKQKKKFAAVLLKGLGLINRIPELMDYLIRNGQQMDVLCLAHIFNMVNKYPPFSLLKGYVEKAKRTAMEISQENMTHQFRKEIIIKELEKLRRAHGLAKKKITDSNLCTSIREEIDVLIGELEKKKRSLALGSTVSTSTSQQQQTKKNKKHKKELEHHKLQENQPQGQLSELGEKLERKQGKPQQEKQQKQEDKLEAMKHKQEDKQEEKKQKQENKKRKQEEKQQQSKRPRQHSSNLPTGGYPAMWNAALRGNFGHPPYFEMQGVHHGYPAQAGWSGVHCASPFTPQLGAAEYVGPFTPLYPRPQFYPW